MHTFLLQMQIFLFTFTKIVLQQQILGLFVNIIFQA